MKGLVHLYCGDGKGKTTAALGLGLRASGAGKRVLLAQFLKSGGSSELKALEKLPGFRILPGFEAKKFVFQMDDDEKDACRRESQRLLEEAFAEGYAGGCDVLILDELCAALSLGMVEKDRLISLISERPEELELVMTGRAPLPELLELSDYVTEMKKVKHPFDRDIPARKGIEF